MPSERWKYESRTCCEMTNPAIQVENISKKYRIRPQMDKGGSSFKSLLNSPFKWRSDRGEDQPAGTIWALKNVSFTINHGEFVGLIGLNGAGKSTLLRIISRITYPTEGRITLYKRVSSLLEIGTGFNAELTGRDNIFLNGSFLGMSYHEIKNRFDEIIAFSEIEKFIDTPVKYYSSGMFIRLAFSVAAHLTPELLLLDEVLSVGDAAFQEKSYNKMKGIINSGATILMVSHNPQVIREVCDRVIYLQNGCVKMDGDTRDVLNAYLQDISS